MIQDQSTTPKQELKNITISFYAIVAGAFMYAGIILVINQNSRTLIGEMNIRKAFIIAAGLLAVICFFLGNALYKKKLDGIANFGVSLKEKMVKYKIALVSYVAACEGAALFAITAFFLTGVSPLLAIGAFMIVAMFLKQPTKSRIFNDLQLDSKEQMELT